MEAKCCEKVCDICGYCSDHPFLERLGLRIETVAWKKRAAFIEKFHKAGHSFGTGYINIKTGELR